jgi:signal transduction histidine kinase
MLERGPETKAHRILVVDGEPGVADHYRRVLSPVAAGQPGRATHPLEDELFGAPSEHEHFPTMEIETCRRAPEAIASLRRSVEQGNPYSVVFVDPYSLGRLDGLEVVDEMRALDPDLQIVIVSTRCELHPAELCRRVPPAHSLFFMNKPFHGAEIQHQALALTAKWQADRARAPGRGLAAGHALRDGNDASAMLEGLPAAFMVFDRHDRLLAANGAMARLFPELEEVLRPGTRYEDFQLRMAERLLPEDTFYRIEHWIRDRLEWHGAGGGLLEQKLRGSRWAMVAESGGDSGETYCQFIDITASKQRELSRAHSARMTQMAQAFGALCEHLRADMTELMYRESGGKVVSLHPGSGGGPSGDQAQAGTGGGDVLDLMTMLQAVAQRQKLTPEAFDLDREVARARREAADIVPASVAVEVIGAAGLWNVLADRDQLRLALRALIANACEALEGTGRIELETANLRLDRQFAARRPGLTAGEYVRISVSDDGPGLSPELAERAFNPFFTSKPGRRHTGLGLSVVHGFVSQSGGHVEFREGTEAGATIDIYLPRTCQSATPSEDPDEALRNTGD